MNAPMYKQRIKQAKAKVAASIVMQQERLAASINEPDDKFSPNQTMSMVEEIENLKRMIKALK